MSLQIHSNVPGNVKETLMQTGNQCNQHVSVGKSTYNKNFQTTHEAVLSSMQNLSQKTTVCVTDTHGKSGLSAFWQILKNIWHNFKLLFQSGAGRNERTALADAVGDLEAFAKHAPRKLELCEQRQVKALYDAVKNAKTERVKSGNALGDTEKVLLFLAKKLDQDLFAVLKTRNMSFESLKARGESFEQLVSEVLTTAPGDKKAFKTLQKKYERLQRSLKDTNSENQTLKCDAETETEGGFRQNFTAYLEQKANAKPTALADRLETALKAIAEKADFSLDKVV